MTDVIEVGVVGGGPTGLMLACELALAGVRVRLFERRSEPVRESRALTVHPRSLEVLALRGLEERFLSRGKPLPTGHFAMLDTRLDFSVLDTTFPFTLFLPQALTESLLEERARELGVDLRRGHAVEALQQDDEGVVLTGMAPDGTFHCRARYVVGADGARSRVRELAGIPFVGTDTTVTSLLGDVVLGAPPSSPVLNVINGHGGIFIVPVGPGLHRVILSEPERMKAPLREPATFEELRAGVLRIAGTDFGMHSPRWVSRFGNETRLAETYRAGRVLLAGDAAHIHFPAGGQGLNVGVQDAMNLGWKLASVVHGLTPPSLLDSYEAERRDVARALVRNTEAQTALISFSPQGLALRDTVSDFLRHPELNRKLAEQIGGMDVAYPAGLDLPVPRSDAPTLPSWVGRRLPDLPLRRPDGTATRLYSALHDGKWQVLHLREDGPALPLDPDWSRQANVVRASPEAPREDLRDVGALLIRPDGHVAQAWSARA